MYSLTTANQLIFVDDLLRIALSSQFRVNSISRFSNFLDVVNLWNMQVFLLRDDLFWRYFSTKISWFTVYAYKFLLQLMNWHIYIYKGMSYLFIYMNITIVISVLIIRQDGLYTKNFNHCNIMCCMCFNTLANCL